MNPISKFTNNRVVTDAGVFLFLLTLLVVGQWSSVFERWELGAYDLSLRWRMEKPANSDKVVQILANEEDLNQLGWPLSDQVLAKVLNKLHVAAPRVIGLDFYREQPRPPGHEELVAAFKNVPETIAVFKFGGSKAKMVPPPPVLDGLERSGFADWLVDSDGVVRQGLLYLSRDGRVSSSLALRLGLEYLAADGITAKPDPVNPKYLRLGKTTLRPLGAKDGGYAGSNSGGYRFLLDFRGGENPFQVYSFLDLLEGRVPAEKIEDRIVILGPGADSVKDQFLSPFSLGGSSENAFMFGPVLHAHAVNQLLRIAEGGSAQIITINEFFELLWLSCWIVMGLIIGRTPFNTVTFAWRTSLAGVGPLLIQIILIHGNIWLPSAVATLGFVLAAILATAMASHEERKQRRMLRFLLDKSVSPAVAEEILANREQVVGGGKIRTQKLSASVLFTDLVNFTPVAERMEPEVLMLWLNEYMGAMAGKIMVNGGVVDKFIGDAIMALFGVPVARESEEDIDQDVVNAVSSAMGMWDILEHELIPAWKKRGLPEISMRVGIHTGMLVAGGLGHEERMDYTVLGDTVNIAARLESLKPGTEFTIQPSICRILISEAACARLGGKFETALVGDMVLKGRSETIEVHQVLGVSKHND
ncbi:MAG: adenylate/guanylate cyclase domain-containing protein [Magnetococcales bacterium]|nr:adenylate/guanylate cyclase domain-containing protein [Magnetococcales bacterium]